MQVHEVSVLKWRRIEEIAETTIHVARAGVRPVMDFLDAHGKGVGHALDLTETLSGTERGFAASLGVANLVLGLAEMSQSYHALKSGDRVRGYLSAAGGTSSFVGGSALLYAACTGSATLGPVVLSNLGTAANGIGAMVDGLEDMAVACRGPEGEFATWLGGLKVCSGTLMLTGAMTNQPILQAAASGIYLAASAGQHVRDYARPC